MRCLFASYFSFGLFLLVVLSSSFVPSGEVLIHAFSSWTLFSLLSTSVGGFCAFSSKRCFFTGGILSFLVVESNLLLQKNHLFFCAFSSAPHHGIFVWCYSCRGLCWFALSLKNWYEVVGLIPASWTVV